MQAKLGRRSKEVNCKISNKFNRFKCEFPDIPTNKNSSHIWDKTETLNGALRWMLKTTVAISLLIKIGTVFIKHLYLVFGTDFAFNSCDAVE